MLPLSEKRLSANRANAAKSTGPVTHAGKARVASNAIRHGLLAKQILIGNESPENFKILWDSIVNRFEPVDDFELNLIEELVASYWRLRRAWALETEMFENAMQKETSRRQLSRMDAAFGELAAMPKLPLLYRYESRLQLMYQRALKNLLMLRGAGPRGDLPNKPKTPNPCNEIPSATGLSDRPILPQNRPGPTVCPSPGRESERALAVRDTTAPVHPLQRTENLAPQPSVANPRESAGTWPCSSTGSPDGSQ